MAFQAHNLQAHAQQLEVESAHPVSSHINVGLQQQVDQVRLPHVYVYVYVHCICVFVFVCLRSRSRFLMQWHYTNHLCTLGALASCPIPPPVHVCRPPWPPLLV